MLKALIEAGMTQQGIADAIGVTQPTVFRALNGSDVRYTTGKAIESLYAQKVGGSDSSLRESEAPRKSAA